jgi:hypothetical protein
MAEDNPHGVIRSRHQQQFNINVFVGPACFVTWAYREPLPRFPLTWSAKATGKGTTDRAWMWYMHDGAPPHFSRAVRGVLNNTRHDRGPGRGHMASTLARFERSPLLLTKKRHFIALWMPLETIRNYPGISKGMRWYMICVDLWAQPHGGHFEHLL